MSTSPCTSDSGLLAVLLARERVMAALLARMHVEPRSVSLAVGGQLWLVLTQTAYNQLRNGCDPEQSPEELIQNVCSELSSKCHLILEPDKQNKGPSLKVNTANWFLVAKPGDSAWVAVTIRPQTQDFRRFRGPATNLPWQLVEPGNPENAPISPLPLWLFAQANLVNPETGFIAPALHKLDPPADEHADAERLRRMRDELPDAVEDLCSAFRLLQWERQRRTRQSWTVTLTPLNEADATNGRSSYVVDQGKAEVWPQRPLRLALGLEPHARWVEVAPDPDSPSRWLLHSRAALSPEITLFELAEDDYRRQAGIAARLTNASKIQSEDAALAATQVYLPTTTTTTPEFHLLPGEAPWEPRQKAAVQLAMAGHAVCAIKGPPGTGKSTVIVGLIRRAIHAKQRVLLVAPTHVALDEVLGRVHGLREKSLERSVVPARVAPADESKIEPKLKEYIAQHLGRNLARNSLQQLRKQLAALPTTDGLNKIIRQLAVTKAQLLGLAERRDDDTKRRQEFARIRSALEVATRTTRERNTALSASRLLVERLQKRDGLLAEATQRFRELEPEIVRARDALTVAEGKSAEKQAELEHARQQLSQSQAGLKEAESRLALANKAEAEARPGDWWGGRLWESVFAAHAGAVQAVNNASKRLSATQGAVQSAKQSLKVAEADSSIAEQAATLSRRAMDSVSQVLRERLAPTAGAIESALAEGSSNWLSNMPDSLRRAVSASSDCVRTAIQEHAQAKTDCAQAEAAGRSLNLAHTAAEKAAASAHEKLRALEVELVKLEIAAAPDLLRQITAIDSELVMTVRELERTTRRRELLRRWQEFYEHDDADEQLIAWALNSVNLVAATTQGIASSKEFREQSFDLVICDESSRVTRGEILVPADRATRVILVGDEKQLPPYVEADDEQLIQALATIQLSEARPEAFPELAQRLCDAWNVDEPEFRAVRVNEVCERARQLMSGGNLPAWPRSTTEPSAIDGRLRAWRSVADAITGSCFDHLLNLLPAKLVVRLSVQRRMVAEIATLVSEPVYGGDYQSPAASPVAPRLTPAFRHAWVFLNTRSYCAVRREFREAHEGTGFTNEGEARAVVLALKQHVAFARRSGKPLSLMVITFYLAQARLIESLVRKEKELWRGQLAILPIDRCQGQEADAVVVSFVRTLRSPRPNAGRWLQDVRRLNVAFTRARHSLVLVGNLETLLALRGDAEGEKLLAHLGRCVSEHPDHQLEQLHGL